jgi:hypothetical protein
MRSNDDGFLSSRAVNDAGISADDAKRAAVRWRAACPGAEADMASEGVILTNTRDAFMVFGVKDHQARKVGNWWVSETHTVLWMAP